MAKRKLRWQSMSWNGKTQAKTAKCELKWKTPAKTVKLLTQMKKTPSLNGRTWAKTAECELKQQNDLRDLEAWRPFGSGGARGLKALQAWRLCGPGGYYHPPSQLLSFWVKRKVVSTFFDFFALTLFLGKFIPAKPTALYNLFLRQNV